MNENKSLKSSPIRENKRPIFITILALLHIIGGGFFLVLAIMSFFPAGRFSLLDFFFSDLLNLSGSPLVFSVAYLAASALGFVSGLGMFFGLKWGWYLGTFYYAYNIFRNVNAIFLISNVIPILPHEVLTSVPDPRYESMKYIIRILIYSLIYGLFFLPQIKRYFSLNPVYSRYFLILAQFLICVVLASMLNWCCS